MTFFAEIYQRSKNQGNRFIQYYQSLIDRACVFCCSDNIPFLKEIYHRSKHRFDRFMAYYQSLIDRACTLPYPARILIGSLLIIVGIIGIPNPLINGRIMIVGGIAIITKKDKKDIQTMIDTKRHLIIARMRQRWMRVIKRLPSTQTVKNTLYQYKKRLANDLGQ